MSFGKFEKYLKDAGYNVNFRIKILKRMKEIIKLSLFSVKKKLN